MKISKEQKKQNMIELLKATTKLSKTNGFKNLTMKSIAKEAGFAEATIYNYFSSKEQIIFEYFSWTLREGIEKISPKELEELSFTETIQLLLENQFTVMKKDRDFIEEVFSAVFLSPMLLSSTDLKKSKEEYLAFIRERLGAASRKNSFPPPAFESLLIELMWDFHVGAVYYWIKDDSVDSLKTSEMIELSLRLFDEILKSDVMGKLYSISHFLIKEHLLGRMFGHTGKLPFL